MIHVLAGIALAIVGASWFGSIALKNKADKDAELWPKDKEY